MIGRDHTYFHPTLCLDPHFIVTGNTDDIFCSDELQLVRVEEHLHRHLRDQGFDAVMFLDLNRGMHFFDRQSAYLFRTGSLPEQRRTAARSASAQTGTGQQTDAIANMRTGPFGARRIQRPGAGPPAQETSAPEQAAETQERLNRNEMPTIRALSQAVSILQNPALRCALVLNNIVTFQRYLEEAEHGSYVGSLILRLNALMQLGSSHETKHSIVVYLFRDSDLLKITEMQDYTGGFGYILRARLETRDARENRIISLRTPNAAELRNYLNSQRLSENGYPVAAEDVEELAITLAGACSRKNWTLNQLILGIEDYYRNQTPARPPLSMRNWMDVMDDHGYVPPLKRLDNLVGLQELKKRIHQWYARMDNRPGSGPSIPERSNRFTAPEMRPNAMGHALNVQLRGGAGTGKTTIARILGEIYYDLGLLPQGHIREVTASDLVSANVGETPRVVHEQVMAAMGGVLFIDEAYALASNDHGREAIDQLVADMSRYEGQFAVVLAGYPKEIENLLSENQGLSRRFPAISVYELPDYTGPEMRQLLELWLQRAHERPTLDPRLEEQLDDFCENWVNGRRIRNWGNAGEAQNLVNQLINNCSERMAGEHMAGQPMVITREDIPENLRQYLQPSSANLESAMDMIDHMIGLGNVKRFLHRLCNDVRLGQRSKAPGNYIFYGPPGTGKTTVGRRMAELLFFLNVLPSKRFQYCQAQDLTRQRLDRRGYPMTPSQILDEELENAWRGILFIDEAHQLATTDQGRQIIYALIPKIEDPVIHANVCVILAGYSKEMRDFLAVDKGLSRRFPTSNRIRFENYTANELRQILEQKAQEAGEIPEPTYLDRAENALARFLEKPVANFGNGGYIRDTFLTESVAARQKRLLRIYSKEQQKVLTEDEAAGIDESERRRLTAWDIPASMVGIAGPIGLPAPRSRNALDLVNDLVGKQEVKKFVHNLRTDNGNAVRFLDGGSATLHIALSGPNGSGRHTVARTLARVWKQLDRLETQDFVLASRGNMVSGYVGQTSEAASSIIEEAVGGTLIVENPSSMLPTPRNGADFGPEALAVLTGAMQRTDMCIILIDSEEGMERLFQANSSFRSCLAASFKLEDPTPEEMLELFRLQTRDSMVFEPELDNLLFDFFQNWVSDRGGNEISVRSWGNGLEIPPLVEELRNNWETLGGETRSRPTYPGENPLPEGVTPSPCRYITKKMFPERLNRYLRSCRVSDETALKELNELVGLDRVKEAINAIERSIRFSSRSRVNPGFYCFIGNPGVGKTKVARLMGGILRAVKVLEKGHLIERTAQQMMANPNQFEKTLKLARDGVLFIDEAHQLAGSSEGQLVIQKLLTVLEDAEVKRRTCIILAGYPAEMEMLLKQDSGLQRRFGTQSSKILFDDYKPDELLKIMEFMAARPEQFPEIGATRALHLTPDFLNRSLKVFHRVCAVHDSNFGNAGFVRNYLHDALAALFERLDERGDNYTAAEQDTLTGADIPPRFRSVTERPRMTFPSDAIDVSEHTLQELEQQCLLYSVYLEVYDRSGTVIGEATGGIIHPDGYVLTCHHVVNAKNNEVDLFGDNTVRISATVNTPGAIGGDTRKFECEMLAPQFRDCDMALLRMKGSNFPYASLRPAEQPVQALEKTLLSGYPLGKRLAGGSKDTLRGNLFRGEISSVMEVKCEDGTIERCYLDGRGLHGNSGSPVFSAADGRMIGVFSGSVRPNQKTNPDELNFFYPIRYFWERFTQLPADDRTESAAAAPAEAENAADAAEAADNAAASKAAEQGGGHHGKREEDA